MLVGLITGCGRLGFDPISDEPPGPLGIAAGDRFSCALRPDGTVWCWGDGGSGQLGDGSLLPRSAAGQVSDLARVVQIDAGLEHACARRDDGSVLCWGRNDD